MPKNVLDYVPSVEDSSKLLNSVLHLLVQKRPPKAAEVQTSFCLTLRKVVERTPADVALIIEVASAAELTVLAAHVSPHVFGNDDRARYDLQTALLHCKITNGSSVERRASSLSEPVLSNDTDERSAFAGILSDRGIKMHSLLLMPLQADGEPLGILALYNARLPSNTPGRFSHEDLYLTKYVGQYFELVLKRMRHPGVTIAEVDRVAYLAQLARCAVATTVVIDSRLAISIGEETIRRYRVLPIGQVADHQLRVVVDDPLNQQNITDFEIASGSKVVEKFVASENAVNEALEHAYSTLAAVTRVAERLTYAYAEDLESVAEKLLHDNADEESMLIISMANRIIEDAYTQRASDIHLEPAEDRLLIRYRIDGYCRIKLTLPKPVLRPLIARIKIMCELDIAEHRLPQDGKIVFKRFSPNFDLDLRVSIAPMSHGESVVMRILDKQRSTLPLEELGFSTHNLKQYEKLLQLPYGMILHCGPTGSGKSMTLYAALNKINSPEIKILTAEDPIEYTLPRINQMQMKPDIGLTFAHALRCFLRQDPDIILVGEIRDRETAEIAIEAALTGHLLFSTLHTNDAASTITRLSDIGIERMLISSTLNGICAQRLVRRLCKCKLVAEPTKAELLWISRARDNTPVGSIYKSSGCKECNATGYRGRIGVHELLIVTDDLRRQIASGATESQVRHVARQNGMRTLFEDSMEKVKLGSTSILEVLTTAKTDEEPFVEQKDEVKCGN